MAKVEAIARIQTDYIAAVLAGWNGDLAFTGAVDAALLGQDVDRADVLHVIEDGITTSLRKEDAHDTFFERTGETVLGVRLRVTLSFDPHLPHLTVEEVAVL